MGNDLDLLALNKLEEFLMSYKGCLILVSHDRYFLDKLTDHLLIFEGEGQIKDHYGSYSSYKRKLESLKLEKQQLHKIKPKEQGSGTTKEKVKTKLSFNEKREYEQLETEIAQLEAEKCKLEAELNGASTDYESLTRISTRISELIEIIDDKTMRWMELAEFS